MKHPAMLKLAVAAVLAFGSCHNVLSRPIVATSASMTLLASLIPSIATSAVSVDDATTCINDGTCSDARPKISNNNTEYASLIAGVTPVPLEDLFELFTSSTKRVQRQMERLIVRRAFPDALDYTTSKFGNYSDGSPAGSRQWIGDVGNNNKLDPSFASFGTVLDLSAANTDGGTVANSLQWMASLLHRRSYVFSTIDHEKPWEEPLSPCRTDLLDDYDTSDEYSEEDASSICLIGAEMTNFVSVRLDEKLTKGAVVKATKLNIVDYGEFINGGASNWLDLLSNKELLNGRTFDTIIVDGVLDANDDDHALPMHMMDLVLEEIVQLLKPGGQLFVVGQGPDDGLYDGEEGMAYTSLSSTLDAIKSVRNMTLRSNTCGRVL